jgi:hypothetical protein
VAAEPLVSIIIPHYLGDVISECLGYIYDRTGDLSFEVIVADDQPYSDGSLERATEKYPDIRVVKTGGGKGMGTGCNRGLEVAGGRYAMLLNNDVEVSEGWLHPLVNALEKDERIAACQPKVLSMQDRKRFDYGGAAGGLMDYFGYTFCLGRIFETVELDSGQYDTSKEIFWGVGGALFVRMTCVKQVGLMDEAFYMHMEEIDWCWRLRLAGYRILSIPDSVVYHFGGWTLKADSLKKAYYNHRNQLVMILKNLSLERLFWTFPVRVCMELGTVLLTAIKGDWKHPVAALAGLLWVITHPISIFKRRRASQAVRRVSDQEVAGSMYRGAVAIQYFLKGKRTANLVLGRDGG